MKKASTVCDGPVCDEEISTEPIRFGPALFLDWYKLSRGNGDTKDFCSTECLKQWITSKEAKA